MLGGRQAWLWLWPFHPSCQERHKVSALRFFVCRRGAVISTKTRELLKIRWVSLRSAYSRIWDLVRSISICSQEWAGSIFCDFLLGPCVSVFLTITVELVQNLFVVRDRNLTQTSLSTYGDLLINETGMFEVNQWAVSKQSLKCLAFMWTEMTMLKYNHQEWSSHT